jgi:hypothetical protein
MQRHAVILLKYIDCGKWKNSNHTIFQLEGLMDVVLTFYMPEDEGGKIIEKCESTFKRYVENSVSVIDGTTKEHAPFYHPFLMERIRVHNQYLLSNGIKVHLDVLQVLRKMNRFMWLSMPARGLVPPIGDTKYAMYINEKYYRAFLDKSFVDTEVEYFVSDAVSGVCPDFFHQFREDGYYIFRDTHDLKMGLFSTFLEKRVVGPHGHFDGGSFITYLGPHPIFIDSGGPFKYRDALRHSYFQTQLAHNTLIIESPVRHHNKVITSISGPNFAFVASRAEMSGGNVWYRVFGQIASNLIVVVDLAVCSDASTPIQLRYHLAPEARFVDCADGHRIIDVAGHKAYVSFQDVASLRLTADSEHSISHMPSHTLLREFDPSIFPVAEQTMAMITRKDDEHEPGNMICRQVVSMHPVVMLAGFAQRANVQVVRRQQCLDLNFAKIVSVWPGGCLSIDWHLDDESEEVSLTLTENE